MKIQTVSTTSDGLLVQFIFERPLLSVPEFDIRVNDRKIDYIHIQSEGNSAK